MFVTESLRSVMSMSWDSIRTSTLNRSFVTLGIVALGPPTRPPITSVGLGTASSSANREGFASSRGMWLATTPAGSRRKYGSPYATSVKRPAGLNGKCASSAASASESRSWSPAVGVRVRDAGTNSVKTGPKRTMTPFTVKAGGMKLPMSNWMFGSGPAAMARRFGIVASCCSMLACDASTPAAPSLSAERRLSPLSRSESRFIALPPPWRQRCRPSGRFRGRLARPGFSETMFQDLVSGN
jgi:hypothetical protein